MAKSFIDALIGVIREMNPERAELLAAAYREEEANKQAEELAKAQKSELLEAMLKAKEAERKVMEQQKGIDIDRNEPDWERAIEAYKQHQETLKQLGGKPI